VNQPPLFPALQSSCLFFRNIKPSVLEVENLKHLYLQSPASKRFVIYLVFEDPKNLIHNAFLLSKWSVKTLFPARCQERVAQTYNPNYLRGRDQQDQSSRPTQPNKSRDFILKLLNIKKGWWSGSRGRIPA
jgi:hypothetical protein